MPRQHHQHPLAAATAHDESDVHTAAYRWVHHLMCTPQQTIDTVLHNTRFVVRATIVAPLKIILFVCRDGWACARGAGAILTGRWCTMTMHRPDSALVCCCGCCCCCTAAADRRGCCNKNSGTLHFLRLVFSVVCIQPSFSIRCDVRVALIIYFEVVPSMAPS